MNIYTVRDINHSGAIKITQMFGDECLIWRRVKNKNVINVFHVVKCGHDDYPELPVYSAGSFKENMTEIMDNIGEGCRIVLNTVAAGVQPKENDGKTFGDWAMFAVHQLANAPDKALAPSDIPDSVKFDRINLGNKIYYVGREV